jgi:hypothetical protein
LKKINTKKVSLEVILTREEKGQIKELYIIILFLGNEMK